MKLIVGLGNPGKKYLYTRHNLGFMVIDSIAKKLNHKFVTNKNLMAQIIKLLRHGNKYILVKPITFMNQSGISVRKIVDYYKIDNKEICIILDDITLPIGMIRIRDQGSSGGHNGLKSIIKSLDTDIFLRIRIGIAPLHTLPANVDKMNKIETKEFVLEEFDKKEKKIIDKIVVKVTDIVLNYINGEKLDCHTYHI